MIELLQNQIHTFLSIMRFFYDIWMEAQLDMKPFRHVHSIIHETCEGGTGFKNYHHQEHERGQTQLISKRVLSIP